MIVFRTIFKDQKIEKKEVFEAQDIESDPYSYIKIKVKKYRMNGEENSLIQMIDETQNIMYQNS